MNASFLNLNDPRGERFAAFMVGKHVAQRQQAMFSAKLARITSPGSICDFVKAAREENRRAVYWLRKLSERGAS